MSFANINNSKMALAVNIAKFQNADNFCVEITALSNCRYEISNNALPGSEVQMLNPTHH